MKPEFQYGVEIFCWVEGDYIPLKAEVKTEQYAIVLDEVDRVYVPTSDNGSGTLVMVPMSSYVLFDVFFYNERDHMWYRPCEGPYHSSRLEELVPLLTKFQRILKQDSHRFAPSPDGDGFVWK